VKFFSKERFFVNPACSLFPVSRGCTPICIFCNPPNRKVSCLNFWQDKDILEVMINGGTTVTVTIMPTFVFQHIVKK